MSAWQDYLAATIIAPGESSLVGELCIIQPQPSVEFMPTPSVKYSSFRVLEEEYLRHLCRRFAALLTACDRSDQQALHRAGKRVDRLEALEHSDLCYVILKQVEEGQSRKERFLCGRQVNPGMVNDLRYVQGLRNKYDHSRAIELSAAEQLSDLIIAERFARMLEFNSPDPQSKALFDRFEYEIKKQADRLAKSAIPDAYDRERSGVNEEDIREVVRSAVATVVAELPIQLAHLNASGEPSDGSPALRSQDLMQVLDLVSSLRRDNEHLVRLTEDLAIAASEHRAAMLELRQTIQTSSVLPNDSEESSHTERALTSEEDFDEFQSWEWGPQEDVPVSRREARDFLIGIRERMWAELGTGPSSTGLLRRKMLEHLLDHCPTSDEEFRAVVPLHELQRMNQQELGYLPEIFRVLGRVVQ